MQKNKTHLFYALICLSVTVPMLSGCRFNGPPYRPSSWEFYSMSSKEYFAPFAPAETSEYDDVALARQFENSPELPKANVTPPRGDYLNSRETKVADNRKPAVSDPYADLLNADKNYGTSSMTAENVPSAKPQSAASLFDQTGSSVAASQGTAQTAREYGTTTPIDQSFHSPGMGGQLAAGQGQTTADPMAGMYGAGQNGMNTANPGAGMLAGMSGNQPVVNQTQGYNPNDPMYGQQQPWAGSQPAAQQPQMVASNQGTGYVGQGLDYGFNTPANGMPSGMPNSGTPYAGSMPNTMQNGAIPGTMQNQVGQPAQNTPAMNGGYPGYENATINQPGMQNPAATGTTNLYQPQNTQPTYGTQPQPNAGQYTGLNTGQPYQATQPATNPSYPGNQAGGFSSFAPMGGDYTPGGGF